MLLANVVVDSSQHVSILSATSPPAKLVDPADSTDVMLHLLMYESVATVLRQFDNERITDTSSYMLRSSSA